MPHLRRDRAHPGHICAGTGLTPATSAPGLGSLPAASAPGHRHRRPTSSKPFSFLSSRFRRSRRHSMPAGQRHICTGNALAHKSCHICTRTELTPATSAPGLGTPEAYLHRDWPTSAAYALGTWLARATSAPGLGSPLPHLHRNKPANPTLRLRPAPLRASASVMSASEGAIEGCSGFGGRLRTALPAWQDDCVDKPDLPRLSEGTYGLSCLPSDMRACRALSILPISLYCTLPDFSAGTDGAAAITFR
jgi:hypothetical protein